MTSSTQEKMKLKSTNRGFKLGHFTDSNGCECSIQKSSSVVDRIWLGIDNPKLTIFEDESMGKYKITDLPKTHMVDSRMHLTKRQVKDLIPLLQKFVETGELH